MAIETNQNRRKMQTLVEELNTAYERIDQLEDFVQQQFSEARTLLTEDEDNDIEVDENEDQD